MLKKCTRCGSENKQEYNFCTICGKRFDDSMSEVELMKKIRELHDLCKKEKHTLLVSVIPNESSKCTNSINGNFKNLAEAFILLINNLPEEVFMGIMNIVYEKEKAAGGHQQQNKTL